MAEMETSESQKSSAGLNKSGIAPDKIDVSNSTNSANETTGPKRTLRGNGAEVLTDEDEKALIAKQEKIEDLQITSRQELYNEHGDVGSAGSYRIDGSITEV